MLLTALYNDELGVSRGVGWLVGWLGLIIEKAEITIFQIYRFLARSRSLADWRVLFSRSSFHLSAIIKAPWSKRLVARPKFGTILRILTQVMRHYPSSILTLTLGNFSF